MRTKQDALAEYYRQLDNQMQGNLDIHSKMVLSPYKETMMKREMVENKDYDEFLRRQDKRYDNDHLNGLKNNQALIDENAKLLKNREYEREIERINIKEDDLHAQGEKNAFMFGKEADLEEERQKKNLYKQTLLYQQAMNEHHKNNFGKMTYAGKALYFKF